eukprot:Hpha_TRINITY_DN10092_c0_g1::TRINITY_DN10092_c0_g1_i1::g.84117::m.84117
MLPSTPSTPSVAKTLPKDMVTLPQVPAVDTKSTRIVTVIRGPEYGAMGLSTTVGTVNSALAVDNSSTVFRGRLSVSQTRRILIVDSDSSDDDTLGPTGTPGRLSVPGSKVNGMKKPDPLIRTQSSSTNTLPRGTSLNTKSDSPNTKPHSQGEAAVTGLANTPTDSATSTKLPPAGKFASAGQDSPVSHVGERIPDRAKRLQSAVASWVPGDGAEVVGLVETCTTLVASAMEKLKELCQPEEITPDMRKVEQDCRTMLHRVADQIAWLGLPELRDGSPPSQARTSKVLEPLIHLHHQRFSLAATDVSAVSLYTDSFRVKPTVRETRDIGVQFPQRQPPPALRVGGIGFGLDVHDVNHPGHSPMHQPMPSARAPPSSLGDTDRDREAGPVALRAQMTRGRSWFTGSLRRPRESPDRESPDINDSPGYPARVRMVGSFRSNVGMGVGGTSSLLVRSKVDSPKSTSGFTGGRVLRSVLASKNDDSLSETAKKGPHLSTVSSVNSLNKLISGAEVSVVSPSANSLNKLIAGADAVSPSDTAPMKVGPIVTPLQLGDLPMGGIVIQANGAALSGVQEAETNTSPDIDATIRTGPSGIAKSPATLLQNYPPDPFGELLIPDPFEDPMLGEYVRFPINDIHRYIGSFVMTAQGEICFWNPKMAGVTGISEEEAWGNHVSCFLLHDEEHERMQELVEQALEMTHEEAADYTSPIPSGKFSFACSDGVNRCTVTLSMVPSFHPGGEYILALCRERLPTEARMDCVVWTLAMLRSQLKVLVKEAAKNQGEEGWKKENPALTEVVKSVQKLTKVCEKQDVRSWGKLSLADLFGKLQTECLEEADAAGVHMKFHDIPKTIPSEVQMDVRKLPQVLGYLIHNAIRFNHEGGKVEVRLSSEDIEEGGEVISALVFEVIDTGSGMSLEQLETLFKRGRKSSSQEKEKQKMAKLESLTKSPIVTLSPGPRTTSELLPEVRRCNSAPMLKPSAAENPSDGLRPPMLRQAPSAVQLLPAGGLRVETASPVLDQSGASTPAELASEPSESPTRQNGTGFGLVMTGIIVQELGGTLDVESDVGVGSTFRLMLPLLPAEDSENMPLPASPKGRKKGKDEEEVRVRCLVVQPNSVFRASLCHYLWGRKFMVTLAFGMEEVYADLHTTDCLFLSVDSMGSGKEGMSDSDRESLLEKLKLFPDVRVVLTSNGFSSSLLDELKSVGMLTLTSPLRPGPVGSILDSIEDHVREVTDRRKAIDKIRVAFSGGGMAKCPWERKKKLGTGSFGDVYEAVNLMTGGRMAVKVMRLDTENEKQALEILNEVKVMSALQHPNIIHYFHTERSVEADGDEHLLIFMEFAAGGTLKDKVPKTGMKPEVAANYTQDILTGLHYLHSNNIIHRDIKTANILLGFNSKGAEVCKLTDFGTATEVLPSAEDGEKLARSLKGTPIFMAPEVMNEIPYDWHADIWSIACLVMELASGKPPFQHVSENPWGVVRYVASLKPNADESFCDDGGGVNIGPYQYHTHTQSFLKMCLQVNPTVRPSCELLLQHPFVTELNQSSSNPKALLNEARHSIRKFSMAQMKQQARQKAKNAPAGRWGKLSLGGSASEVSEAESNFSGWGDESTRAEGETNRSEQPTRAGRKGSQLSVGTPDDRRISVGNSPGRNRHGSTAGAPRTAALLGGKKAILRKYSSQSPASASPRNRQSPRASDRRHSQSAGSSMARSLAELRESRANERRASVPRPNARSPRSGAGSRSPVNKSEQSLPTPEESSAENKRMSISGWE